MKTLRIHRTTFTNTDHGRTWIESAWFELDGSRCSPTFPVAGCCERLGILPGGPIPAPDYEWESKGDPYTTERSESVITTPHTVGSMSISPA